jgi:transcriptional regulator with XRE-family HTH domain
MTSAHTDSDVVAFLLGDSLPPERLGALLHAGRKRKGWKRKQAAAMVRISAKKLRAYEKGTKAVPAEICERLAECYGSDLTAHVPMRSIPEFGVTAGAGCDSPVHASNTPDAVIAAYVAFVRRLRRAEPGEPLPLRAADLNALSAVLEADPAVIERRIMDELGCSLEEARALHRQVLLRRVVLPVAGLAASVGVFAGIQVAHASAEAAPAKPPVVEHSATVALPSAGATTDTTAAPPTTAAAVTSDASARAAADQVDEPHAVDETSLDSDPFAGQPQIGDDDFVDPPDDMPRPVIVDDGDYTEVGIPEGEEPSYDTPTTVPPDEPEAPVPDPHGDPGIDHEDPLSAFPAG